MPASSISACCRLDAQGLAICLAQARESGARLPLTALVDQFYADVQALGAGAGIPRA
jgi:3-hydroxyisobutyrate dehydrogenase-like beta-hydroxyacid dehydrogenase